LFSAVLISGRMRRLIAAGRSHLSCFVTRHRGFSRSDSRKRAGSAEKAKVDFEAAA
jgi:hypothetical protein